MSFWGNHHSIKKTTWYKISKVFQCHIMLMSLSMHQQTCAPNATALLRLVLLTCLGSDEDHNPDQRWLYSVARGKNKKKLDTFDKHCAWSLNFRAARIDRKGKQASEHSGARALNPHCTLCKTSTAADLSCATFSGMVWLRESLESDYTV